MTRAKNRLLLTHAAVVGGRPKPATHSRFIAEMTEVEK
jgi:hypothetical protein